MYKRQVLEELRSEAGEREYSVCTKEAKNAAKELKKANQEYEKLLAEISGDVYKRQILLLLAQNAGIVFSKEQIYNRVWKEPYFGNHNIVMSHIRNLREKIEDDPSKPMYIQTVWGVGYRFNKNLSSGL